METIKPAQLSFLAIYNPSLGQSDETLHDQIVYYYSRKLRESKKPSNAISEQQNREDGNEKLRQIGLAQGMVEFAKAFSDGAPVDAVDSEKSRILMHELETGWWMLASVELTQIQTKVKTAGAKQDPASENLKTEYSAREVCPKHILLQHLLQAHSVFLLHHAPSLANLYTRLTRPKFCAALDRFWDMFVRGWDVLLHGTPAVDLFDGFKLAAGGELGIGVGEEEWGSGEREVLEGFIQRTEGLIDLVVSRFGNFEEESPSSDPQQREKHSWLGSGFLPSSADGVIFSGVNAITRHSLTGIAKWMEWVFQKGQAAYGVQDNPHAPRRRRRRKPAASDPPEGQTTEPDIDRLPRPTDIAEQVPHGIPPPIVTAANKSLDNALKHVDEAEQSSNHTSDGKDNAAGADVLMKYMTFGLYGSGWGLPHSGSRAREPVVKERGNFGSHTNATKGAEADKTCCAKNSAAGNSAFLDHRYKEGCFLIGLKGDLDHEGETDGEERTDSGAEAGAEANTSKSWNSRILLRTLQVERTREPAFNDENPLFQEPEPPASQFFDRVQTVVYVRRPFIFTFLFELQTPTLNYTSFYRSIHHQLGPLQRPLLRSTSPSNVLHRVYDTLSPRTVTPADSKQPIYDLVYDPLHMTIHTTIPPIPDAGDVTLSQNGTTLWSRLDALNVHSQIVSTFTATRRYASELERTAKTSRGWWVVWIRLPTVQPNFYREAFLIRKSTDYVDQNSRKTNFGFGNDTGLGWGSSAGKLAEGIGIDTRRYVEGLLNLNR